MNTNETKTTKHRFATKEECWRVYEQVKEEYKEVLEELAKY